MTPPDLSELPERLSRLHELALDLSWTWSPGREVFRRLDYQLWKRTHHNPVLMLRQMASAVLERAANDAAFLAVYDRALLAMDATRVTAVGHARTFWHSQVKTATDEVVAYFSAEFALHQSLPIYAGGLGVLAGDHCKEASDLGIPFVGVGFMYPQGYFRQRVSPDGWQQEVYEHLNWEDAPIQKAQTRDRKPCVVAVPLGTRTVLVQVWQVRLGRVRLLLLDTNLEANQPWDRELTARLYGGGQDTRLQQEIVLGLGGVLALRALGLSPAVWHLNEGHAAFVVLQRLRDMHASGTSWEEALVEVRRTTVFTTHTPVPAGHDAFPFHLVEQQLASCWGSMGAERDDFLALGTYDNGAGSQFNIRRWRCDRPARLMPSASFTASSPARCSSLSGRTWPLMTVRWAPLPTAFMCPPGSAATSGSSLIDTSVPSGRTAMTTPPSGRASLIFRMVNCGRCARRCASISSDSYVSGRASGLQKKTQEPPASWPAARCSTPTRSPSDSRGGSRATNAPT